MPLLAPWWVYLLRCADDSLYCGITVNMELRLAAHNNGTGAKYTRGRGPFEIEALIGPMGRSEALQMEARIKRLSKDQKAAAFHQEMGCASVTARPSRGREHLLHLATTLLSLECLLRSPPSRRASLAR